MVPLVYLIPWVIRYAQNRNAKGTLIVLQWLSSPFWPLFFPDEADPADFVVEYCELPSSKELILPGQSGNSLLKGLPNTPVLTFRLNFSVIKPEK